MKCKHCNCNIPAERLEILPETDTCVQCADIDAKPDQKAEFKYDSDGGQAPRHW